MLGCRRAKNIEREQIFTETYSEQMYVETLKVGNKMASKSCSPSAFAVSVKDEI